MHIPYSYPLTRMAAAACIACTAFSTFAVAQQDLVIINQDTEWPYTVQPEDPGSIYGDRASLYVDSDITINGSGGIAIDGRGIDTIIIGYDGNDYNTRYSLTINNGSIVGDIIALQSFKSITFSNAGAQSGSRGLVEASLINRVTGDPSYPAMETHVNLTDFTHGLSFTNNGRGGSTPDAAIWSQAELSDESVYAERVKSEVNIYGDGYWEGEGEDEQYIIPDLNISNNTWGESAIYSSATGRLVTNADDYNGPGGISSNVNISNVGKMQFVDNLCGGSLITSHVKAEPGAETIEYSYQESGIFLSADHINISNNTANGEYGLISSIVESRPAGDGWRLNQNSTINVENVRSAIFSSNRVTGDGGVFSSILKADAAYSGPIFQPNPSDRNAFKIYLRELIGDMVFENNHADGKGGAIYVSGGYVSIVNRTEIEYIKRYSEEPGAENYSSDIIFKGNTMGNGIDSPIFANSIYVEGNNGYNGGIDRFNAWTGTRIVFEGSVISKPTGDPGFIFHINTRDNDVPTVQRAPEMNDYTGTVLFTGQNVRQVITRQNGESDESYANRIDLSLTSRIEQDTMLHNGTLAVQHNAKLLIKNFMVTDEALLEDEETGNFYGANLNTDFNGLIHVQGSADLTGLADISLMGYLDGKAGTNAIRMKIDLNLMGRFELLNHGNLYESGLLDDSMSFILLTLMIEDGDTDVTGLMASAARFNEGLGLDTPEDMWQLEWIYGIDGADTKSLVLKKDGSLIPEPSIALLGLFGLLGLGLRRRR